MIYVKLIHQKALIWMIFIVLTVAFTCILARAPLQTASSNKIPIPIIMYHGIYPNTRFCGPFVITPKELECDFQYILQKGYTAVTMQEVIDYVHEGIPLPPKPIILTFDDGQLGTYVYAYPLLKQYQLKAVFSIVGEYINSALLTRDQNPCYAYLNWDQVREMADSGFVEVQNHSYSLHSLIKNRKGSKKLPGELLSHYEKILQEDVGGFQAQITKKIGKPPNTFVYPFGFVSKESIPILQKIGFKATLSCYEGINYISENPDSLFGLKRNNRPHGISSDRFFKSLLS